MKGFIAWDCRRREIELWRTRAAFDYLHRAVARGNQSELVSYQVI